MTVRSREARRWVAPLVGLLLLGTVGACVQDSAVPGAFNSPSELGLALNLTASPDILPLDGAAQSLIGILARDASGESVPDLRLLLQIATDVGLADFGQLSSREVTTGRDGRAAATYTAPLQATSSGAAPDTGEVVTIWVTPIGDNFDNSVARALSIRLIPSGTVIPPFGATAGFVFTPETPEVLTEVLFTTACPDDTTPDCVRDPLGLVTTYRWSFGDGHSATGPTGSNSFDEAGTYLVTLTIEDGIGRSDQVTRSVVVGFGKPPMAVITFSPTAPKVDETVFFNATLSTADPGRTLVSHKWDFGDGNTASGSRESHVYADPGIYNVTLTVKDDAGQVHSAFASITIAAL